MTRLECIYALAGINSRLESLSDADRSLVAAYSARVVRGRISGLDARHIRRMARAVGLALDYDDAPMPSKAGEEYAAKVATMKPAMPPVRRVS